MSDPVDCLVIGGGPAGLTAAVYLGRFRRSVRIFDAGASRASLIPITHNVPGFPAGIAGQELLQRLREQATRYCGNAIVQARVDRLEKLDDGLFAASAGNDTILARHVLLATGSVDIEPELPDVENAVRQGYIRHCPICDGYEIAGQKVALIGYGKNALKEALFIRHFTDDLTLLTLGQPMDLKRVEHALLSSAGIKVVNEPVTAVYLSDGKLKAVRFDGGQSLAFDTLYSALGSTMRSELAAGVNASMEENGELFVDRHYQTSVTGLYAAGDIVAGLNQISVAAGHAAIAATAIHNSPHLKGRWSS
jgi:thioredoxin reductase (NADPH)